MTDTIDIIEQMVANKGRYKDDPPAIAIFEYSDYAWNECYTEADVRRCAFQLEIWNEFSGWLSPYDMEPDEYFRQARNRLQHTE